MAGGQIKLTHPRCRIVVPYNSVGRGSASKPRSRSRSQASSRMSKWQAVTQVPLRRKKGCHSVERRPFTVRPPFYRSNIMVFAVKFGSVRMSTGSARRSAIDMWVYPGRRLTPILRLMTRGHSR